jgi:glutathione S-transferase
MAQDIVFYHAPQSRSIIVQWMLEELGQPFDMHVLNLKKNEHKASAYLAVNPMGKVPAITHKGVVITEAAAICAYLADAYPKANLAPDLADPRRGPYLRWMFFGPSCMEPAIIDRMFKREGAEPSALGYGSFDTTMDVVAEALSEGPFILGDSFTAADVIIGSNIQWGTMTKALPPRKEFEAYSKRLMERPALKRVFEKDAEMVKKAA